MHKIHPGIYAGISNTDYHADKTAYSSSIIKKMHVPALAKHAMDSPQQYKDVFRIGTAIHMFILERDKFNDEFLVGIDCARRSKADKQNWIDWFCENGWDNAEQEIVDNKLPAAKWYEQFQASTGKHIVTPEELDALTQMAQSVSLNETAIKLLKDGVPESSIYWEDKETGIMLKCRPDFYNDYCSDLKSCQSAAPGDASRQIASLGYHISAAMYQDGILQATGEYAPFLFIFIEKNPPYLCAVYSLNDESNSYAYAQYRQLVVKLAECLESNQWPGYDDVLDLSLPGWVIKEGM